MSEESRLEQILETHDNGLYQKFNQLKETIHEIFWSQGQIIPHFTDHSDRHSKRMIQICDHATRRLEKDLNAKEIYRLLTSIYLHDVGMQLVGPGWNLEDLSLIEFTQIRKEHVRRSVELIKKMVDPYTRSPYFGENLPIKFYSVLDKMAAHDICMIVGAHMDIDAPIEDFNSNDEEVRLPLLCALLKFADSLDITEKRVFFNVLDFAKINIQSRAIWEKYRYVQRVEISDCRGDYITLHYQFPEQLNKEDKELIMGRVEANLQPRDNHTTKVLREAGIIPIGDSIIKRKVHPDIGICMPKPEVLLEIKGMDFRRRIKKILEKIMGDNLPENLERFLTDRLNTYYDLKRLKESLDNVFNQRSNLFNKIDGMDIASHRLFLVAAWTSLNACRIGAGLLEKVCSAPIAAIPSPLPEDYKIDSSDCFILVSESGETFSIIKDVKQLLYSQPPPKILAITQPETENNHLSTEIAQKGIPNIHRCLNFKKSIPDQGATSTKGFLNSIALFHFLSETLGGKIKKTTEDDWEKISSLTDLSVDEEIAIAAFARRISERARRKLEMIVTPPIQEIFEQVSLCLVASQKNWPLIAEARTKLIEHAKTISYANSWWQIIHGTTTILLYIRRLPFLFVINGKKEFNDFKETLFANWNIFKKTFFDYPFEVQENKKAALKERLKDDLFIIYIPSDDEQFKIEALLSGMVDIEDNISYHDLVDRNNILEITTPGLEPMRTLPDLSSIFRLATILFHLVYYYALFIERDPEEVTVPKAIRTQT